jgi:hypothetical protein
MSTDGTLIGALAYADTELEKAMQNILEKPFTEEVKK